MAAGQTELVVSQRRLDVDHIIMGCSGLAGMWKPISTGDAQDMVKVSERAAPQHMCLACTTRSLLHPCPVLLHVVLVTCRQRSGWAFDTLILRLGMELACQRKSWVSVLEGRHM